MQDDNSRQQKPDESKDKLKGLENNLKEIIKETPNSKSGLNNSVINEKQKTQEKSKVTAQSSGQSTSSTQPQSELTEVLLPQNPVATEQLGGNFELSGGNLSPLKKGFGKKIGLIFAALLLVTIALFALSKIKTSQGGSVGKRGEITWWGIQDEESTIQPLIDEYQKTHPKVHIKYIKQSTQDYRVRLTNSLKSGKGPDIFEIHNSWPAMFSADLEPIPASTMSVQDYAQTYYPVIVTDMTTKTGIVGIPLEYDAVTLYVNQDIFAAAAKTYPKLWDDVISLARDLTQKDALGNIIQSGVPLGITENVDHWPEIVALMLIQNGANPSLPNTSEGVQAIGVYTQFANPLQTWNNILPPSTVAFAQGNVAMYFGPARRAAEIIKTNPNLHFRTVTLPQLIKNKPDEPDFSYATYWVESVWSRGVNKKEAWEFLKFISSKESLTKIQAARVAKDKIGRPYPRIDMNLLQVNDSILGSVIALAPQAKSGYLDDETFDGAEGINSQINGLYATAIKARGGTVALDEVAKGVAKVYSTYGIPLK